jgi:hypothetical protein
MKTLYKLTGGVVSTLKEVHLETIMTTAHFDDLALLDDTSAERGILSCLSDLMEEDPFKLSMQELYYVFLLVRMYSFGPMIPVTVTCRNLISSVDNLTQLVYCNTVNDEASFTLEDTDLLYPDKDFIIPEVSLTLPCIGASIDEPKSFYIKPPIVGDELALIDMYQEQGYSRGDLSDFEGHKELVIQYSRQRSFLYLRDKETDEIVFSDRGIREKAIEEFKKAPVSCLRDITRGIEKVDRFGVTKKRHQVTCKACGKPIFFRTGLLSGVTL